MGKIVAAYGTSHILFSPQPAPEMAQEIVDGMKGLGQRMTDAKPDLILVITSDHLYNFDLAHQAPFCIGTADAYEALGDMGIPQRAFAGHPGFAQGLIRFAAERDLTIRDADAMLDPEPLVPDHAVTLPMMFIRPWGRVPVVPLYTGIHLEPYPSPAACLTLGRIIHEFVDKQRPRDERIAVIASGGLSHWLQIPGMGTVAEDYDNDCIETFVAGRCDDFAGASAQEIFERSGNGGLELLNWIAMAATVPDGKAERAYYVPMLAWQTGMAGVAMKV
jgi:2'-aminobiphenyl-2,3-diol 1,2-dioxygenase large subunit